jgi:hypothetical protein
VADRPLRPATDRRLGRPLPHQLPNRTQAAPKAPHGFEPQLPCGISPSFPGLSPTSGYVPTRYSPVRRCPCRPRDLHVLSMPPAFALSQDQTLRFISAARPKPSPADAYSIRLRSPLSMQSTPSSRHHYPPIPARDQPGSTPSAYLLPKDRCDCQRSVPIHPADAAYKCCRRRKQGHPTSL